MLLPLDVIKTRNKIIMVRGKVLYNDRKRKIDLKRPIRDLFDTGSMNVFYMMELALSEEKLVERVKQLSKENVIPIILYFTRGGDKQ